jgi:hypothetical protein
MPLDWAETQTNLGAALVILGQRESGTARLEEAVTAYRTALEERTRDRMPLDWAETQNDLGAALALLSERKAQPQLLKEALEASRAAREVYRAVNIVQYEADLTDRIEALEAEIAAANMR